MSFLGDRSIRLSQYRDQRFQGKRTDLEDKLLKSTTLYVGNLAFVTTEEQIHELFSRAGPLKRIIMGLDKIKKTPCGFCFVEYYLRYDAENAMRYINGTRLDDRVIRTDWDAGYTSGREFGRGRSGGQVRDEYRQDYDPGRGGYELTNAIVIAFPYKQELIKQELIVFVKSRRLQLISKVVFKQSTHETTIIDIAKEKQIE
ncbi:hypothetical protein GJ496_001302 [Pomphorhynchus laevis]|nr:hypothetical protein GJ496_001302 [Pomphorhynchus laevis]